MKTRTLFIYHTKGAEAGYRANKENFLFHRSLGPNATLVTYMVRDLFLGLNQDLIKQFLEEDVHPTPQMAKNLLAALSAEQDYYHRPREAMQGEIQNNTVPEFVARRRDCWRTSWLFDQQYEADTLQAMRLGFELADKPYTQFKAVLWPPSYWYHVDKNSWPGGKGYVETYLSSLVDSLMIMSYRRLAEAGLVRIGLILELYRQEHGGYPAALDKMRMPDGAVLPVDPFDGQPFHYRRQDDGYILWSVSVNCVDDVGKLKDLEDMATTDDIVLWIGSVARRARQASRESSAAEAKEDWVKAMKDAAGDGDDDESAKPPAP